MLPDPRPRDALALRKELLDFALSFPAAQEHHPWGETVVKAGAKVFVFLGMEDPDGRMGVKLGDSHDFALTRAGVEPSRYGLGAKGWVSVRLADVDVDAAELREWVDESYRLVALKRLVRELDAVRDPGGGPGRS